MALPIVEKVGVSYPLEVWSDGVDFVDDVLDALETEAAERVVNNGVVGEGDALSVHFAESAFVDQFAHRLDIGISPRDVGQRCGITISSFRCTPPSAR